MGGKNVAIIKETEPTRPIKVLLVDDEDHFRSTLAKRLARREFDVSEAANGEEAIRAVRLNRPDVVMLDRSMPGMNGEVVLREIKGIDQEVQVIILTGQGSIDSAKEAGKLGACSYLEKPCELDATIEAIRDAFQECRYALAKAEMFPIEATSIGGKLWGVQNYRPGILILAALILFGAFVVEPPEGMKKVLSYVKTGDRSVDGNAGYSGYSKMEVGETIAAYHSRKSGIKKTPDEAARSACIMVGVLFVAALVWGTGALPIGIMALAIGMLMYFFGVFKPEVVADAYAKDAVIFIMGVIALAKGIAKTGLDRRIGILLLGTSKSVTLFLFLFWPLMAVTASFISANAMIVFVIPILVAVYNRTHPGKMAGKDKSLAIVLILATCFAANAGGPGSPSAGGRNALMVGILQDYGQAPSFGEWVMYGLPFVPVMTLVIAAYFFLRFRKTILGERVNIATMVLEDSKKIGAMTMKEYITAGILVSVILLWITASKTLGMGGPVLFGLVALGIFRIIGWREINSINWDVVALYAGACAMGTGLADTGAAVWLANSFVSALPEFLQSGEGLAIAVSFFTGALTNIMSDGATVSAVGPLVVPMAMLSDTPTWMVGLSCAFSSSFANCLIIGTPANAIAYSFARDSETGEQLISLGDFLKHGLIITGLMFLVLWLWTFYGYWRILGF